jgi:hypothetical protein
MSKTLVGVNTLTEVKGQAYSSHCQEWFRMGRDTDDTFMLYNPIRTSIDNMRNTAVVHALRNEADYIYFIDDDMILSPSTYRALKEADKDIIMANTIIRGYPYHNMSFIDPLDKLFTSNGPLPSGLEYFDDWAHYVDEKGLVRLDAIGNATALFKVSIFKDVEPPYFVTMPNCTEDVYCCMKLQRHYGRRNISIYMHPGVPTGHILDPLIVCDKNAALLKKQFEEGFPELAAMMNPNPVDGDRGHDYAKEMEEAFK